MYVGAAGNFREPGDVSQADGFVRRPGTTGMLTGTRSRGQDRTHLEFRLASHLPCLREYVTDQGITNLKRLTGSRPGKTDSGDP